MRVRVSFSSVPSQQTRHGLNAIEVVIVLVIALVGLMAVMLILPRQREVARTAGCRSNLSQIGIGLALYDASEGRLPTVPAIPDRASSPLKSVLETLGLPDLTELSAGAKPPPKGAARVPAERPVPGFVCPSDVGRASRAELPAPVSYRATTGDQPDGGNGGFAPGQSTRLAEIDEGDGRSFTAAFSERLIGNGQPVDPGQAGYRVVPGPLLRNGCPPGSPRTAFGDAGATWAEASWRSTLYNHAMPPQASPSCIDARGASAFMGASSAHIAGVNVLTFDGGVRTITPTIAPQVWKALATTRSGSEPHASTAPITPPPAVDALAPVSDRPGVPSR